MRRTLACYLVVNLLIAAQGVTITGKVTITGPVYIGQALFQAVTATWNEFLMTASNLNAGGGTVPTYTFVNGVPTNTCTYQQTHTVPVVGFQNGVFMDGMAIFFPWAIQAFEQQGLPCVVPHGNLMTYTPATGTFTSNSSNQWRWYNFDADSPWSGNGCAPGVTNQNCPHGFNSGVQAGAHRLYLLPDALAAPNAVFVLIDTTNGASSLSVSYQAASSVGITNGQGWSIGAYDGTKYLYMNPTVNSPKFVQKDTSLDGSGLASTGWKTFNPSGCSNGDPCTNVTGSLGMVIVNGRYVYHIPTASDQLFVVFDSGAAGNANFQLNANWTGSNWANLNTGGHPTVTGATPAQVAGFAGGTIAQTNGSNNGSIWYLYMFPWSTAGGGSTQSSITCRVQVAHWTGSFNYDDPTSSTAQYQCFDLATLTSNPAWSKANFGPPTHFDRGGTQSVMAGMQLGWTTPNGKALYNPANGGFFAQHDPTKAINDPTAWTLFPRDVNYADNSYGGPYNTALGKVYPSNYARPLNGFGSGAFLAIEGVLPAQIN